MNDSALNIPWHARLTALAYYLGAAPIVFFRRKSRRNDFLIHHLKQALALFAMLLCILLAFFFAVLILTYVMLQHRALYDHVHPEPHTLNITRKLFLCWLVFWAFAAALALRGSMRKMPLVNVLSKRRRLIPLTAAAGILLYTSIIAAIPLAIHANSLTRQDPAPGAVYLLYEDIDRFPRWIFTLGFFQISRAANERWGPGQVVALRLSQDSLKRALREGRFVFIGSHGMKEGLLLKSGFVLPKDIQKWGVNPKLRFVYLTSCDSGTQKEAWENAFAPAKVVTYDRLTALLEHIAWLWFKGPGIIRSMDTG